MAQFEPFLISHLQFIEDIIESNTMSSVKNNKFSISMENE